MALDTADNLWPGWETVGILGQGSFGAVYEIRREVFGEEERAALKVISIPQSKSELDDMYGEGYDDLSIQKNLESQLKNIVSEYSLMRKLNGCANVVHCDDVRYEEKTDGIGWNIYIKMELLTPLMQGLPQAFSEKSVIRIGKDICHALEVCNHFNIIHRDIKPQNMFLNHLGECKLGDFGIAKTIEKTSGGTKIGTFKYMAPEVYGGRPYGAAADIYSLGLVLYWLMNERRAPFVPLPPEPVLAGVDGEAANRRIMGEPIPAPKNGSAALKKIVLKACAYNPADRYHSAEEMRKALEDLERMPAVPVSAPAPAAESKTELPLEAMVAVRHIPQSSPVHNPKPETPTPPPTPQKPSDEPKKVEKPKPKKRKFLWLLPVILIVLIAGIVIFAIVRNKKNDQQDQQVVSGWTDIMTENSLEGSQQGDPESSQQGNLEDSQQENPEDAQQTTEPTPITAVPESIQISAGFDHTVGLKSDGTVVTIGGNTFAQCYVSGWTDIVAISADFFYTVGLQSDGTVVATGDNLYGQCDVSGWTDIIAVSAGTFHTVGLKSNGTVVAVGHNELGQCDVSGWTDIVAVSAGSGWTVGLKSDGTVVATVNWSWCDVSGWTDIVAVSAGWSHTAGLKADGAVVATGDNEYGQCDVSDWTDIVSVSAGRYHTIGLKSDGTVVAAGDNECGQCDVSGWTDIVAVSAGDGHTVGLKSNGTVVATGRNDDGQCDVSGWTNMITEDPRKKQSA